MYLSNFSPYYFDTLKVRVDVFPYVGVGNSTNKKDAQTNSARDFIQYLVRQGKMSADEVPPNLVSNLFELMILLLLNWDIYCSSWATNGQPIAQQAAYESNGL